MRMGREFSTSSMVPSPLWSSLPVGEWLRGCHHGEEAGKCFSREEACAVQPDGVLAQMHAKLFASQVCYSLCPWITLNSPPSL